VKVLAAKTALEVAGVQAEHAVQRRALRGWDRHFGSSWVFGLPDQIGTPIGTDPSHSRDNGAPASPEDFHEL
jgi:hypothetical protein